MRPADIEAGRRSDAAVPTETEDKTMTTHGEILVYQTDEGGVRLDVRLQDEKELLPEATHKKFLLVRQEGSRHVQREVDHYDLDAIISVGYRVKSKVATRFRIWATERLKEYIVKGFTMDDERLRNPPAPGAAVPDYFDELLERIRDIRASERRMYLRVREIFAMAAELIRSRANAELPNMGSVSKQSADEHAAGEYEEFSVRRREYKELQGAKDYLRQLEDIAQNGGSGDE
jgi:hypothetical protein